LGTTEYHDSVGKFFHMSAKGTDPGTITTTTTTITTTLHY